MKEFFGFGGYQRPAEGYFSKEHLIFVSILMVLMVGFAAFLGLKNRGKDEKTKNTVLIVTAITVDALEIFKIVMTCIRSGDALSWVYMLPLFLCGIQLITIPLAAFSKGRIREASLDFVFIFGVLGAVLGTYFAGQNYSSYPVLSLDNVFSGLTHAISGFAALYIAFAGMQSMKKKNIPISIAIVSAFCVLAYAANLLLDYNYMFLMRGDGTPYDIIYNLVSGNAILYPIIVVLLFMAYIAAFYGIYYLISTKLKKKPAEQAEE